MLQSILSFDVQGLLLATLVVLIGSLFFLLVLVRMGRKAARRIRPDVLFDLLTVTVMVIPILAFGMMAILLMAQA